MNRFENWFCASGIWRWVTQRKLLPWIIGRTDLGEHLLEMGAGPGAATEELRRRAGRVTSLEYDHKFAAGLAARMTVRNGAVLRGDAARLPFADQTFTSAIAVLVLHHLCSSELQGQAFAEIHRVLRPGGVFLAFEIQDSWMHRAGHIKSTFVPVAPTTLAARMSAAGFPDTRIGLRGGGFRWKAVRDGSLRTLDPSAVRE